MSKLQTSINRLKKESSKSTFKKESELKKCFALLEEGEKKLQLKQNEVVLVLGVAGSGKTTLVKFLAENDTLVSKEDGDTGEYTIENKERKIDSDPTIGSKTVFPEFTTDSASGVVFSDCPGFGDTHGTAFDVAGMYFIKKVIKNTKNVKFVLTLDYSWVRKGTDRGEFIEFVRYVLSLIENIEKYGNSMAFIVTKVDNKLKKVGKEWVPVSDELMIDSIVEFLTMFKANAGNIDEGDFTEKVKQFIDILLSKDENGYKRIAIFRRPDESGSLAKIESLTREKTLIKKIVTEKTVYASVNEYDFGFPISEKSKNDVNGMVEEIKNNINGYVNETRMDIQKYYESREAKSNDIYKLQDELYSGSQKVQKLSEAMNTNLELKDFMKKLLELVDELEINLKKDYISALLKQNKYIEFLESVSQKKLGKSNLFWKDGLSHIIDYLKDSGKWYKFLIDLYDRLSSYEIQKDKTQFKYLIEQKVANINDKNLKQFVQSYGKDLRFEEIQNLKIDSTKLNFLNLLFKKTLADSVFKYDNVTETYEVHGDCIKLSDIDNELLQKAVILNLFATNKILIDADLINTDKGLHQVSIIAPTYEIIGQKKIMLNGKDGCCTTSVLAGDGSMPGEPGKDGIPGEPGKSAGHFFGIAENIINEQNLAISANGGRGEPGQNGGRGADGWNEPPVPVLTHRSLYKSSDYTVQLKETQYPSYETNLYCIYPKFKEVIKNGGNGGSGGVGGHGGKAGNITLILMQNQKKSKNIIIQSSEGEQGSYGYGGSAGKGSNQAEHIEVSFYNEHTHQKDRIFQKESSNKCSKLVDISSGYDPDSPGSPGSPGIPGINAKGAIKGAEIIKNESKSSITQYINFLRQSLTNEYLSREKFSEFLNQLSENSSIINLYGTLELASEFIFLEDLFIKSRKYFDFLPTYQQLLRRVQIYATQPKDEEKSAQFKQVLDILQVAILSKICLLKKKPQYKLITDTRRYLDSVFNDVKDNKLLQEEYVNDYMTEISNSIKEANTFIQKNSVDELEHVSKLIGENTKSLIREITETKKVESTKLNDLYKELEYSVIAMKIILVPRRVAMLLKFVLNRTNIIISKITPTTKYLLMDNGSTTNTTVVTTEIEESFSKAITGKSYNITRENITKNSLHKEEQTHKHQTIINTCDADINKDCVKVTGNDELDILDDAVNSADVYLTEVQFYVENLDNLVTNTVNVIADTNNTTDITHISGIVKNNVNKMKLLMQKIKENFKLPETLISCLDKMERGSSVVIRLYEHLEYYEYLHKMVTITKTSISTPKQESSTEIEKELKNTLKTLHSIVESNLSVTIYQTATLTINELIFPFADSFATLFKLNLSIHDIVNSEVKSVVLTKLQNIKSALDTNENNDEHVYNGDFVLQKKNNNLGLKPFYTWRNEDYNSSITDLLSGKEIILKADVSKGVSKHAVKFNTIGLQLKLTDQSLKNQLENDLQDFHVMLTHLGDSVYKCGNEFYVSTFEKKSIMFSFAKNDKGEPVYTNNVYKKLKEGDFVLSPYTYWSIQLKGSNSDRMKKYANLVDVVLEGRGQFIENTNLCNSTVLKNYYQNLYTGTTTDGAGFEVNKSDLGDTSLESQNPYPTENPHNSSDTAMSNRTRRSVNPEPNIHYLHRESIEKHDANDSPQSNWLFNSASKVLPMGYFNGRENAVPISHNEQPKNSAISSLSAHYNINDTLILTDLLIRFVTKSKPNYFQECSTNPENARACALNIITEFEQILESLSQFDGEYDFDPAKLMAKIENEIINGDQSNVGKILLNAVETESQLDEAEFNRRFKMLTGKTFKSS